MDYTQTIANFKSLIGQKQNEIDALNQAVEILTSGFISDQAKIDTEVALVRNSVTEQMKTLQSVLTDVTEKILPN